MNGLTANLSLVCWLDDDGKHVWTEHDCNGTIVAINQALIDADQRCVNERALTWNLGAIVAAWDAAPADATEAATAAICEKCYPQCTPAEIGDAAAAVILAIGYPLPCVLGVPDPQPETT